jgi:hypothetical protein
MLTAIGLTGVLSTRFSGHLDGCLPPLAPLLRQISSPPGGWRARRAPAVDDGRYHRVLYGLFGDDAKEGGGAGLSHAAGVRRLQHSATNISRRSKSMGAWAGNVVQVIIDGVWLKVRCFATRPSSAGDFRPERCPISAPRRKSAATCSTG